MQLDELQIALRPRSGWEAIDLGFVIARMWGPKMLLSWFLVACPVLLLALWIDSTFWSLFVLWFCKPYYERAMLRILSNAVFGYATVLPYNPANWKNRGERGFLFILRFVLLRFSMVRAMKMPLSELEEAPPDLYRERARNMFRQAGGHIQYLTIVGFLLEWGLFFAIAFSLILLVSPDLQSVQENFNNLFNNVLAPSWQPYFLEATYFFVLMAVAPLYVSAGFSLYLNRRTELEGWDIELGFRNLVRRVAALSLTVLLVIAVPEPVMANTEPGQDFDVMERIEASPESSKSWIEAILAEKVWTEPQTTRMPKFLQPRGPQEDEEETQVQRTIFGGIVALIAKVALVIVVVVCIGILVARLDFGSMRFLKKRNTKHEEFSRVASRARTYRYDEAIEAARAAWEAQDSRTAMSIIYTAAVQRVEDRFHLDIDDSDTEEECIRKCSQQESRVRDAFAKITRLWQRRAYAGYALDEGDFEAALQFYGSLARESS